jgi:hypothetical protein
MVHDVVGDRERAAQIPANELVECARVALPDELEERSLVERVRSRASWTGNGFQLHNRYTPRRFKSLALTDIGYTPEQA